MTAEIRELVRYNAWANRQVFSLCARLSAGDLEAEAGYAPVLEILRHLVAVQSNFLLMSQGRDREKLPPESLDVLRARCERLDAAYERFAASLDGAALEGTFHVPWFGFDISVREAMLQALTHSQKHRADMCMLLPRFGVEPPGLDYIQMLEAERAPSSD